MLNQPSHVHCPLTAVINLLGEGDYMIPQYIYTLVYTQGQSKWMFSRFLRWHELYVSLNHKPWELLSFCGVCLGTAKHSAVPAVSRGAHDWGRGRPARKASCGKSKQSGKEALDLEPPCGLRGEKAMWGDMQGRLLVVVYRRSVWERTVEEA